MFQLSKNKITEFLHYNALSYSHLHYKGGKLFWDILYVLWSNVEDSYVLYNVLSNCLRAPLLDLEE